MQVCLTFDIDFTDYEANMSLDEFDIAFSYLKKLLCEFNKIKTTWYVRVDSQIEYLYGTPDYIFKKHAHEIDWLVSTGHEIGWHHHAYILQQSKWKQNTAVASVCEDIKRYGEIALGLGLKISRMGWGFHTNETMKVLDNLGFLIDSSAIPRPKYKWDTGQKDWSTTPQYPYRPSAKDYRVPGEPHLNIWQLPMTTMLLPVPGDTELIMRYVNPAYKSYQFQQAIEKINDREIAVLICHPYEITQCGNSHSLLAFNPNDFANNLEMLQSSCNHFCTVSEVMKNRSLL